MLKGCVDYKYIFVLYRFVRLGKSTTIAYKELFVIFSKIIGGRRPLGQTWAHERGGKKCSNVGQTCVVLWKEKN